jgi:cytochrome c5
MTANLRWILAFVMLAALIPVLAQTSAPNPSRKAKETGVAQGGLAQMARGQEVFEQNCSRCHNPPRAIPPQITGTILRHMRVRASLSAADEKALLRFMAQ